MWILKATDRYPLCRQNIYKPKYARNILRFCDYCSDIYLAYNIYAMAAIHFLFQNPCDFLTTLSPICYFTWTTCTVSWHVFKYTLFWGNDDTVYVLASTQSVECHWLKYNWWPTVTQLSLQERRWVCRSLSLCSHSVPPIPDAWQCCRKCQPRDGRELPGLTQAASSHRDIMSSDCCN